MLKQNKWMYIGIVTMLLAVVKVFMTTPISILLFGVGFLIYTFSKFPRD